MLAFSHIPKTAGTTLNYILQKNFGGNLQSIILRSESNYTYEDLRKDRLISPNTKCIAGHGLKPFIDYKEFNDELKWFTFLRDPIKRYVSQYIHQQTSNLKQYYMPIEEWGQKYARSNWQVKWIAGEEDLEAAKQILKEKFVFIGITEKFDESLVMMKNCFDINMDISYKKPKMIVRDNSLKNELLKRSNNDLLGFLKEQNELDLRLYEFVIDEIYSKQIIYSENKKIHKKLSSSNIKSNLNLKMYYLKRNLIYRPYVYLTK